MKPFQISQNLSLSFLKKLLNKVIELLSLSLLYSPPFFNIQTCISLLSLLLGVVVVWVVWLIAWFCDKIICLVEKLVSKKGREEITEGSRWWRQQVGLFVGSNKWDLFFSSLQTFSNAAFILFLFFYFYNNAFILCCERSPNTYLHMITKIPCPLSSRINKPIEWKNKPSMSCTFDEKKEEKRQGLKISAFTFDCIVPKASIS